MNKQMAGLMNRCKGNFKGSVWVSRWDSRLGTSTMILVSPGDKFEWNGGGQTDEGYDYWSETIVWHDGDPTPTSMVATDARDCDGRCESFREWVWNVERAGWDETESLQRDHAAEAAGY